MRLVGTLLLACVALAVVKMLVMALLVVATIALIWGICLHPRELLIGFAFFAALSIIRAHPLICLCLVVAVLTARRFAKPRT